MGQFKSSWTPPTNDMHTITATFGGSKSYFASSAQTGLIIGAVSNGAAANTTTSNDNIAFYILGATIVILIALALVSIVLKRKQ